MRSISFGPTSYFESRLDRDNDDHNDAEDPIITNPPSERINTQSSSGNYSAQNSLRANEVLFYSCDNLFRESLVGYRELAMKKNCKCRFTFDPQRTFQSYCFEFCGLLNIQFTDVKFFIKNREVPLLRQIRKPCIIEVYHNSSASKAENNSLKPAYSELLEKGLYSDIDIMVNGEKIRAHKCILIARSEKFKVMLQNQMKESIESKVEINNKDVNAAVYKLLIQWIYEGECDLPDSIMELISLLKLTDEYLLPDLQKVCEEQIIDYMDDQSAVEILTNTTFVFPLSSDQPIKEAAKTILLEDYEKIEMLYPDIEEKIAQVKGLMSELFIHKRKKKSSGRRRKGSILGEDSHKKKVRFNISNTIYEEASAIHDESDSMIEPLSIYSNNSPPGELNDDMLVSSTHSSLHAERRHSGPTSHQQFNNMMAAAQNMSAGNNIDGQILQSDQRRSQTLGSTANGRVMSPNNRLLRPASAGRNDNPHQTFRSNSSISLSNGNSSENRNQENNIQSQNSLFGGRQIDRFNSLI